MKGLRVSYAQAVHDDAETKKILSVLKEHRTIIGKETEEFEKRVATHFGKKYAVMVNSGSSANLIAVRLLNLPAHSEVITPLLTFSTTIAPLLQNGLVPVFADVEEGKYIINLDEIEKLISKKTKALMIPLLIGNVPDMKRLRRIADKHKLFIIEDSCDTLGATFDGKPTGYYTDISTTSFYGSHIITAGGGGGMVMVNSTSWRDKAKVLRGWGRSSSIFSESESIDKRFKAKIGNIQYDAKFIFDEIAYNFMPMEIGSAFGNAQLDKLPKFKATREKNFKHLYEFFKKYERFFILPNQDKKVRTQWLAFPLTIKENSPFTRLELVKYLELNNIQTRPIFTGNILMQPGFKNIPHRKNGKYTYTNQVMKQSLLIGCHHGLKKEHLDKLKNVFSKLLNKYS
ncbi:MAG: aminotransferase class I/II-fold pyridoxal phosphate-dependent enzyme [Candidatus Levybacteria bacterium]|nr:aminotransferase class I/II-fold pyridoxal phosphate-dependent enzyme [Candidatus Levybacteria bacterium]